MHLMEKMYDSYKGAANTGDVYSTIDLQPASRLQEIEASAH